MSINIDWDKLLEDELRLSEKVREFLDNQFSKLQLPEYIQSLSVTKFRLGSVAPEITLKNITDPFPEFYDDYEALDSSDEEGEYEQPQHDSLQDSLAYTHPAPSLASPPLHYFHPALAASLLPNIHSPRYTPLYGVSGLSSPRPQTPSVRSLNLPDSQRQPPTEPTGVRPKGQKDDDVQFWFEVKYNGDMNLGVTTTLLLNYPSPSFVSLPVRLTVKGLQVHSLAVVAYIQGRVLCSFICDISGDGDAVTTLGTPMDIIKDLSIESEIGAQDAVLRNVDKIEKFLLDRLRSIVRDEVAWPGWITFEI
jgi:distribution and morphology protein 12